MRCNSDRRNVLSHGLAREMVLLSVWHNTPNTAILREADDSRLALLGQERGITRDLKRLNLADPNYFRLPSQITKRQRNDLSKISAFDEVGALTIPHSIESQALSLEHSKQLAIGFCALLIGQNAATAQEMALSIINSVMLYFDVLDDIFRQLAANKDRLKISKEGIENFQKFLMMLAKDKSIADSATRNPELRRALVKWQYIQGSRSGASKTFEKTKFGGDLSSEPKAVASIAERESLQRKMKDMLQAKDSTVESKTRSSKKVKKTESAVAAKTPKAIKPSFLESILQDSGMDASPESKVSPDKQEDYRFYKELLEAKQPLNDILKWLGDLHRPFGCISESSTLIGQATRLNNMKVIIDRDFNNNWDLIKASVLDRQGRQGFVFESAMLENSQDFVERLKTGILCKEVTDKIRQVLGAVQEHLANGSSTYSDVPSVPMMKSTLGNVLFNRNARVALTPQGRYVGQIFLSSLLRAVKADDGLKQIIASDLEERLISEKKSFEWLRNYQIAKSLAAPYCHPQQIMHVANSMSNGYFDMRRLFSPDKEISSDTLNNWKAHEEYFMITVDSSLLPTGDLNTKVPLRDIAMAIKAMVDQRRANRPKNSMYGDPGYN